MAKKQRMRWPRLDVGAGEPPCRRTAAECQPRPFLQPDVDKGQNRALLVPADQRAHGRRRIKRIVDLHPVMNASDKAFDEGAAPRPLDGLSFTKKAGAVLLPQEP
jgi:hypothetical protein